MDWGGGMSDIYTVNFDDLVETWRLRGHPVLLRRRWQRFGVDVDSDASVETFCATADDAALVRLLVDLASMSDEPELNRRADYPAARLAVSDAQEMGWT
jgi:hypothetical protein